MPRWAEVESAAPALAGRVREALDAGVKKTLATLRSDGSPRISAIETQWSDGGLYIGSMWRALKALDLRRDPRFALHSPTVERDDVADAKLAGRAVEIHDEETIRRLNGDRAPDGPSHLFELIITELSALAVGDPPDHLVIEVWTPSEGVRRLIRR